MIRFWEIFRCAGVDHDQRHLGMVMPVYAMNYVGVQHDSQPVKLVPSTTALRVEEPADVSDIVRARINRNIELSQPGVDKGVMDAYMPDSFYGDVRYFKVYGDRLTDAKAGASIQIKLKNKVMATMPVMVLDTMTVKIAIRNVMVYDDQGTLRYHANKPSNPDEEVKAMNLVWLPQTQIRFELVPSQAAVIDDREPAVRAVIQKAFDIKDPANATLSSVVSADKLRALFRPHKVSGAAITFFVVQTIDNGGGRPSGLALADEGMAFIIGNHTPATFAHEAGHILGRSQGKGTWTAQPHTYDTYYSEKTKQRELADEDYRMLMRDGGAGFKIPFNLVKTFRGFKA